MGNQYLLLVGKSAPQRLPKSLFAINPINPINPNTKPQKDLKTPPWAHGFTFGRLWWVGTCNQGLHRNFKIDFKMLLPCSSASVDPLRGCLAVFLVQRQHVLHSKYCMAYTTSEICDCRLMIWCMMHDVHDWFHDSSRLSWTYVPVYQSQLP